MKKKSPKKKTKKLPLTQRMKVWHLIAIFVVLAILLIGGFLTAKAIEKSQAKKDLRELSSAVDKIQTELRLEGGTAEKEQICGNRTFLLHEAPTYCEVRLKGSLGQIKNEELIRIIKENDFKFLSQQTGNSGTVFYQYSNTDITCRIDYYIDFGFGFFCSKQADLKEYPL